MKHIKAKKILYLLSVVIVIFFINIMKGESKMGGIEAMGIKEKDINKMIELMMCSKILINEKNCYKFYFKVWGFRKRTTHPVVPLDPITYIDARKKERKAYCEAMVCPDDNNEYRFVSFIGFLNMINPFELSKEEKKKLSGKTSGDYYFIATKKKDEENSKEISLGKEITIYNTMELDEYIHIVVNDDYLKDIKADIVSKKIKSTYEYFYDDKGLILKAVEKYRRFERVYDENGYPIKVIETGEPDGVHVYELK